MAFKLKVITGLLFVAFTIPSVSNGAGINKQLQDMFGSMSNTTESGSYSSVTRAGYVGGGFVVRNQLHSITPINISLPDVSGGCAGIDFFAGSFSFINAEEFVQLLRNVAANSVGLAFQLAINAMDSVLGSEISKLQALVQKLNEYSANSCQLSKGLLVDMAGAFSAEAKQRVGSQLSSTGIIDSLESVAAEKVNKPSVIETAEKSGKVKTCSHYGNIMWCVLSQGGFKDKFLDAGDEQKELVMSMTGAVIVQKPQKLQSKEVEYVESSIAPISVSKVYDALLNGTQNRGDLKIYSCGSNTDTCTNPSPKKIDIKGVSQDFIQLFEDGYLTQYISANALSLEQRKKATLYNVNGAVTNGYTLIDGQNTDRAMNYYREIAPIITHEIVFQYLNSILIAADSSLSSTTKSSGDPMGVYIEKQRTLIKEAISILATEHQAKMIQLGGNSEVMAIYGRYMQTKNPIDIPNPVTKP